MKMGMFSILLGLFCQASQAIMWDSSYESGAKKASQAKKPIMIDFYTDWCGWCKKLDLEVYADAKIQSISDDFICIKVNCERDQGTANQFKISGFPTVMFLSPQAQTVRRVDGFIDKDTMKTYMLEVAKKYPSQTKPGNMPNSNIYAANHEGVAYTRAEQFYKLALKMEQLDRSPQAIKYYEHVMELAPGTDLFIKAQGRIERIKKMMQMVKNAAA